MKRTGTSAGRSDEDELYAPAHELKNTAVSTSHNGWQQSYWPVEGLRSAVRSCKIRADGVTGHLAIYVDIVAAGLSFSPESLRGQGAVAHAQHAATPNTIAVVSSIVKKTPEASPMFRPRTRFQRRRSKRESYGELSWYLERSHRDLRAAVLIAGCYLRRNLKYSRETNELRIGGSPGAGGCPTDSIPDTNTRYLNSWQRLLTGLTQNEYDRQ